MLLLVVAKEAYAKAEEETPKDEGQVIKIYIMMCFKCMCVIIALHVCLKR